MKLYRVAPWLYFSERTVKHPAAYEQLVKQKITMVINLWHTGDPAFLRPPKDEYEEMPDYLHVSLPDGRLLPEHIPEYERLARIANKHLDRMGSHAVLTHCYGGRNRSAFLAALIYRLRTGCTGRFALEMVRQARPRSVANPHFETYLKELR
jgi:protein-tyrosine phosphatase